MWRGLSFFEEKENVHKVVHHQQRMVVAAFWYLLSVKNVSTRYGMIWYGMVW
jgi:hypothetical protein